mmetsp:Transcript_13538/g.29418  ORF Transcript_13538/g.29418 Transcript_13538/m.29418 type:complete len:336 (-) Transcript_13538:55-1062(-)
MLLLLLLALTHLHRSPLKRQKVNSPHKRHQNLRNPHSVLLLIILQQATNTPPGSTQRGIQKVDITSTFSENLLLCLGLVRIRLFLTAAGSHPTCLIVGTVGTTDELSVRLLTGEPRFQIVLLDGGVVQCPADDTYDTVWKAQTLVEFLGSINHSRLFLGTLLKIIHHDAKLLNLFKLMHPEDTTNIPPGAPRLLTKTGGDARIPKRQCLIVNPLVLMIRTNRLFGRGNQILLASILRVIRLPTHFIKLLVEIFQLGNTAHDILVHKVGRLKDLIPPFAQEGNSVIDECLVQQDSGVFEEVAAVSGDVLSADRFVAVDAPEEIVVGERFGGGEGVG